jgi:hypothetical protein
MHRLAALLLALAPLAPSVAYSQALPLPSAFTQGDNGAEYFPFAVDEDALSGAPDRSALNTPITPAARLVVHNGRFVAVGRDGRPGTGDDVRTRLYGVNLSFGSNFPALDDAPRLAKRLRKLGFNAVRLHHMDSFPTDDTTAPGSILTTGPFPTFNTEAMARLKRLIAALSAEGIYVNLNLHVGYRFRADVDQLPVPQGPPGVAPIGNPLHVYMPRMIALQESYARGLIRGLDLRGNPALAMVEINNESSLLAAWQWRQWEWVVPGGYADTLSNLWQAWLTNHYGSTAKACAVWQVCANPSAPVPLLTPADADIPQDAIGRLRVRMGEKWRKVSAQWLGSDASTTPPGGRMLRLQDFLQFLADTDSRYLNRMRAVVKAETDARVPVTGTQMAYGGALNFDSHAAMDYIDEHIYVGHPEFPSRGYTPRDWRMRNVAPSGGVELRRLLAMSYRRDRTKPFVVSEYSQPFPQPRGAETIPVLATIAALQDWDGLFYFDYTYTRDGLKAPANFSLTGDWGKYALTGPSAQIFRQPTVAALPDRIALPLPVSARRAIAASTAFDALDADIATRLGVMPELAFRTQVAIDTTPNASTHFVAPAPAAAATPDDSIGFDAAEHLFTVRHDRVWGVFGDAGGKRVEGRGLLAEFPGKAGQHTSFWVTALDGAPLARARSWLVTLGSWTTGTQPGSLPARPKEVVAYKGDTTWLTLEPDPTTPDQPSGATDTAGPAWQARSPLRLTWASKDGMPTVYPLDGAGRRQAPLAAPAVRRLGDQVTVDLHATAPAASLWYEIVMPVAVGAAATTSMPPAAARSSAAALPFDAPSRTR